MWLGRRGLSLPLSWLVRSRLQAPFQEFGIYRERELHEHRPISKLLTKADNREIKSLCYCLYETIGSLCIQRASAVESVTA